MNWVCIFHDHIYRLRLKKSFTHLQYRNLCMKDINMRSNYFEKCWQLITTTLALKKQVPCTNSTGGRNINRVPNASFLFSPISFKGANKAHWTLGKVKKWIASTDVMAKHRHQNIIDNANDGNTSNFEICGFSK